MARYVPTALNDWMGGYDMYNVENAMFVLVGGVRRPRSALDLWMHRSMDGRYPPHLHMVVGTFYIPSLPWYSSHAAGMHCSWTWCYCALGMMYEWATAGPVRRTMYTPIRGHSLSCMEGCWGSKRWLHTHTGPASEP